VERQSTGLRSLNCGRRPYTIKLYTIVLVEHKDYIYSLRYSDKQTNNMNQIFLIGTIFVAATFLIASIPNTSMAYSCSSSSSTHNANSATGVSGSSGGCSSSSSVKR
jgi:hypothetical protein